MKVAAIPWALKVFIRGCGWSFTLPVLYHSKQHKCSYCQKAENKEPLWSEGCFSGKRGLIEVWQRGMIKFLIPVLYIPFGNLQVVFLRRLKMESQIIQKVGDFVGDLETGFKFLCQNAQHGCRLFSVHRTMFIWSCKIHKLICHNLSQHCTMPSPCPLPGAVVHWCSLGAQWQLHHSEAMACMQPMGARAWMAPPAFLTRMFLTRMFPAFSFWPAACVLFPDNVVVESQCLMLTVSSGLSFLAERKTVQEIPLLVA